MKKKRRLNALKLNKLENQQKQQEEVTEETEADSEDEEKTLSGEEKSFKKRYGDLRRHIPKERKRMGREVRNSSETTAREGLVPPKSDEDIDEWAKEHPDVAGIVETIAAKKAQEMFAKAEIRLQELDDAQAEVTRSKAENKIKETHCRL